MNVAVFFSQRSVANESGEAKVEQFGEGAGFGIVGVGEARAIKSAENGGEVLEEDALEVSVFLVCTDYIWGCGERVGVAC